MALYELPDSIPDETDLVEISFCLPCDERILAAARGAIWGLALWINWQRSSDKRAAKVARLIRDVLECTYEEC